jgi:hypothetical protein
MLGAEASGADLDLDPLAFHHDLGSVDIGQRAPQGMPLGVAYIVPGLGRFAANLTLHRYFPVCWICANDSTVAVGDKVASFGILMAPL